MKCQEVTELMQRYLDKDLVEKEYRQILRHQNVCPECTSMFERLQRLSNELESLPKVTPPYSIVDSIMPKLVELDRMNEESTSESVASSEAAVVMQEQSHTRPEKRGFWSRYVSWGWTGGVVAAGMILGVFLFQNQPSLNNNADSHANQESRIMMEQQSAQPRSASSDNIAMFQMQEQSGPTVDSSASGQTEAGPVMPPVTSQAVPKTKRAESPQSAGGGVDPSLPVKNIDQYGVAAMESEPSRDAGLQDNERLGISSWLGEHDNEVQTMSQELHSPDGKQTAKVTGQRIVIQSAESGDELFVSNKLTDEEDTIILKEWVDQNIIYEIISEDHSAQYVLDVSTLMISIIE